MRRNGLTISPGERSPAATSCSIGVNKMKFSRLIKVTSISGRFARTLSRYLAAYRPAKPPPAITILVFFIAFDASRSPAKRTGVAVESCRQPFVSPPPLPLALLGGAAPRTARHKKHKSEPPRLAESIPGAAREARDGPAVEVQQSRARQARDLNASSSFTRHSRAPQQS